MAKKKAVEKAEEKKAVEMEVEVAVEEKIAEEAVETEKTDAPAEKEDKKRIRFSSDRIVTVQNKALAGKSLNIGNEIVAFDAEGCAKINGLEAKRLVTIPGFEAIG